MTLDLTNDGVSENINFKGSASLRNGFKDHGVTLALKTKGEPVRSGETSFRFELRHGDCGKNPGWNDCAKNRERHEIKGNDILSEKWITTSLFVPEDINMYSIQTGNTITGATSISQFHQHQITVGARDKFSPPFMFNLESSGYTVRNFIIATTQTQRPVLISREDLLGKWVDILFHITQHLTITGFCVFMLTVHQSLPTLTTVHLQPQIKQCI